MTRSLRPTVTPPFPLSADQPATSVSAWWRLGRLGPLVLAFWLTLDLVLRFLPYAWFDPHPIDMATARPGPHSEFTPNFEAVFHDWEGDGAREANLPPTERRSAYSITTDSLGFRRNPSASPTEPPDVLFLLGRSFLIGAALSDDETLPAAFTRASGLDAYNGAGANRLADVDRLLERLPGRARTAVLILLEDDRPAPPGGGGQGDMEALFGWLGDVRRSLFHWWSISPLELVASRLNKLLSDDGILPNEGRLGGRQLRLPDRKPMLFRRYEIVPARVGRSARDAARLVDYAEWWRDQLARRGIDSWVLLMPSRYTIYGPWLETGETRHGVLRMEEYIQRVSRELRARGIRTLNALPVYRASVPQQLETGDLLFYREDNHWNARGVEVIARVLADSILNTRRPAGAPRKTATPSNPTN
jgi:hypothetical protein